MSHAQIRFLVLGAFVVIAACGANMRPEQAAQAEAARPEQPSAAEAVAYIRQVTQFAERLAAKNIVVAELTCDWGSFGNWQLELQNGEAADRYAAALMKGNLDTPGPEAVRVTWDGRESILMIEASPTEPLSAPHDWKTELEKPFGKDDDPIPFAEEYLRKRLAKTARD